VKNILVSDDLIDRLSIACGIVLAIILVVRLFREYGKAGLG